MIQSFRNTATEDVFNGVDSKRARKLCQPQVWNVARRRLDALNAATALRDLKSPGNSLERLEDNREGQWSIRINDQYRVCFEWTEQGPGEVEIVDFH